MSKLGVYSDLVNKLKDGDSDTKELDGKLDNFKKDLQNINDSDWKEVEQFLHDCIDCGTDSTMKYATVVMKKKNVINWKEHPDILTKMLNQVYKCCQQPVTSGREDGSSYCNFTEVLVQQLRTLKLFNQQSDLLWEMVRSALTTGQNRLQKLIACFTEHLPWLQNTDRVVEVMDITYSILEANPSLDRYDSLASCVVDLWTRMLDSMHKNTKKAAACIDPVKKVLIWCKDAEWCDLHDSNKPTLNYRLLDLILNGFIKAHRDKKPVVGPFFDICKELWNCSDQEIVHIITVIMTSTDGEIVAEFGGYDAVMRLIDMFLNGEEGFLICHFRAAYPKCPEPFNDRLEDMANYMEHLEESLISAALSFFQVVATENEQVFTPLVVDRIVNTLAMENTFHTGFLALTPVSAKRPELFEPHEEAIIASMYNTDHMMLYAQGGNILAQVAVACGDEDRARKYMKVFAEVMELGTEFASLCLIINIRTVGDKFPALLAEYKELFEKKKTEPMLSEHCVIALNDIAGRSLVGVAKDIEDAQNDVTNIDSRVTDTDENVMAMMAGIDLSRVIAEALKEETEEQEERLNNLEDVVEEVVENVEEIDKKTVDHVPLWAQDVSKMMNEESESDWRLLAQHLGYSQDEIVNWSTRDNPCLSMFSAWFSVNKTKEATHTVLTSLEEMNRTDAYLIVENALKQAEDIMPEWETEYTTPPPVFISYQWSIQDEVKILKQHLEMAGYQVWMDVGQMGGGEKLFERIDDGIRNAKVVLCCMTEKYAKSPNCNREVNLSVNLKKPMIPLLMEKMSWPPVGSMGPIFGESLFIRFYSRQGEETSPNQFWPSAKFQELLMQIRYYVAPDKDLIQETYRDWMSTLMGTNSCGKKAKKIVDKTELQEVDPPEVFISYQWDMQSNVKALYSRLTGQGYTCWLDIQQMGGGDSLYDKIDKGIRSCKIVLCCMTPKYILSTNCRREASLAKSLDKPVLVLLLEKTPWPAEGSTGSALKDAPCIDFSGLDKDRANGWNSVQGDELDSKLRGIIEKDNTKPQNEKEHAGEEKSTNNVDSITEKGNTKPDHERKPATEEKSKKDMDANAEKGDTKPEHERENASEEKNTKDMSNRETAGNSKSRSDGDNKSVKSMETQSLREISGELGNEKRRSAFCVVL